MLKFTISILVSIACLIGLIVTAGAWILLTTPRPQNIRDCLTTAMFQVHLCPHDVNYVRLKNISPHVRNAVIVSEDGAFYSHNGIDWFEMRESFMKDWDKGQFARGGSTITQQLAKNVYLDQHKSLLRKVREALIAVQLEDVLSKDEILEKYLNVVQFGTDLYGVGPAAQRYFGKPVGELSIAQGAFLAFLLPSPERYSASFQHKKLTPFARAQMREIVGRLFRYRKISEDEHQSALAEIDHFFGPALDNSTDSAPTVTDEGEEPSPEEAPPENVQSL